MAFWHRIVEPKLRTLCTQFHRFYIHPPHASSINSAPKPCTLVTPHLHSVFRGKPTNLFNSVRFFAAPVQAKTKTEDNCTSGYRLNDQIKAPYVRLVIDDGHSVVSRFEALERAKMLKLDLVEVQKSANPPVCKIMDFHKETYKRQEREKERAKTKADMKLRKDCKEVRFSEKTEAKDMKMKADMVKKLMEKGYRVKCKVSGKEDQDLTGLLCRLLALIEDVCIVENGPHMAKKDAYMIVRHVKYGLSKKGGRKLQDETAVKAHDGNMEISSESNAESGFESEAEVLSDDAFSVFSNNTNVTSPDYQTNAAPEAAFLSRSNDSMSENRYRRTEHHGQNKVQSNTQVPSAVTENRYRRTDHHGGNKVQSNAQVPPAVTENRYKRVESRNRFQQTSSNNTGRPGIRDAVRPTPSNWNHMRHVPVNENLNPKIENNKQAFTPGSRHSMPHHNNNPRNPNAANTPRPGYGSFSAPNEGIPKHPSPPNTPTSTSYGLFSSPKGPETQGAKAGMHRNREGNFQDSTWQQFNQESQ
ncbi:translation initiation factor IF3-1, mitochondrial isoform X2 [Abrus precatorius]|uniref:Translation initiation factor IF3-1, mitochondrial isoform X2 n=1 Tax=Abrus precatorius TaxID=3816 RepID=A0A8B8MBK2_ABRPR|nr:translation initiation factor IF3-1, mitochondrial isoform X2 [Abrus precatorius]